MRQSFFHFFNPVNQYGFQPAAPFPFKIAKRQPYQLAGQGKPYISKGFEGRFMGNISGQIQKNSVQNLAQTSYAYDEK